MRDEGRREKQNVKNNNFYEFFKIKFSKKRRIYILGGGNVLFDDFFIQIFVVFLASVLSEQRTWN